jgi:hypothetical protein
MSLPPHSSRARTLPGTLSSLELCLLATALFSVPCRLFALFDTVFATLIPYFQYLTDSFAEIGGWHPPHACPAALLPKEKGLVTIPFRQAEGPYV